MGRTWLTEEDVAEFDLNELIIIKRQVKESEDRNKNDSSLIGARIIQLMCENGETEHLTNNGQWKAQMLIGRTASSVNVKRLVERGVDPDVIKACTDEGKEYSYVKITRPASTK